MPTRSRTGQISCPLSPRRIGFSIACENHSLVSPLASARWEAAQRRVERSDAQQFAPRSARKSWALKREFQSVRLQPVSTATAVDSAKETRWERAKFVARRGPVHELEDEGQSERPTCLRTRPLRRLQRDGVAPRSGWPALFGLGGGDGRGGGPPRQTYE